MKQHPRVHEVLRRRFKIIAFDWDGTAVKDRTAPVDEILPRLEALMALDVKIVIITGTHLGNPDKQFCSKVRPALKRNLFACVNRGGEVYGFDEAGRPVRLRGREATAEENRKMDRVSVELEREFKARYGLDVAIIYDRFNRRKLDIIPLPEWADPPKARIGELLVAVQRRLDEHGVAGGIQTLIDRLDEKCREVGIELRITTDVKHLEYGLSDKADSVDWIINELARGLGAPNEDVLFLGDEFGPIGGFDGSDFTMVSPVARGAVYVSVGKEPNGVPDEVMYYGQGTDGFAEIMDGQIALWRGAEDAAGRRRE
jgi:hypothetical protein